jgi:alkylated DNA repair dioxygenase AlkB
MTSKTLAEVRTVGTITSQSSQQSSQLLSELFTKQRYVLLRSLLQAPETRQLYTHALDLVHKGEMRSDTQVPDTPALYAEPFMESLLLTLLPQIEEASGLSLYPTYSYMRVYKRGDVLLRHRDRPACEISISLNLGSEADSLWPLWIEGPAGASAVHLAPGDALLYRGTECFHWRDAFAGEHAVQCFLHYVDQNGVNAEWRFDKRRGLRLPEDFSVSSLTA